MYFCKLTSLPLWRILICLSWCSSGCYSWGLWLVLLYCVFFFTPSYMQACEMLHKHFRLMGQTLALVGLVFSPFYPAHRLEWRSCSGRLANRRWSQAFVSWFCLCMNCEGNHFLLWSILMTAVYSQVEHISHLLLWCLDVIDKEKRKPHNHVCFIIRM